MFVTVYELRVNRNEKIEKLVFYVNLYYSKDN